MIKFNIYGLISIFISFLYVNTSLSSTIVSHKAYYDLEFLTNETPSIVEGGSGKSSFLLEKQCKGWALKETFAITFNLNNKNNSKNFSIFSSFEDFTAKKFSFEHLDKNDFEKEMFYSGYVQKNKNLLDGIIFDKNKEKFSFNARLGLALTLPHIFINSNCCLIATFSFEVLQSVPKYFL